MTIERYNEETGEYWSSEVGTYRSSYSSSDDYHDYSGKNDDDDEPIETRDHGW